MQPGETLITPDEAAQMFQLSKRQLLALPIRRIRLGHRTIRYRPGDIGDFLKRDSLGCADGPGHG